MLSIILTVIFALNKLTHQVFAFTTYSKELGNLNHFDLFIQQKSNHIEVHGHIPHAVFLENIEFCEIHKKKIGHYSNLPSMWIWEVNSLPQFEETITTITSCYSTLKNATRFQTFHLLILRNTDDGSPITLTRRVNLEISFRRILHKNSELFLCSLHLKTSLLNECDEIFLMSKETHYQNVKFPSDLPNSVCGQLNYLVGHILLRRLNFRKEIIIGAVLTHERYVYDDKFQPVSGSNSQVELLGGINIEVYRYLRDALNFSESSIQVFGGLRENSDGTLNNSGLAKALNSDNADISIPVFEYIPFRISGPHRIQFLHPMVMSRKAIAVFVQPPKSDVRNVYGRPYASKIWVLVATLHMLEMLTFFIIISVHSKLKKTFTAMNTFRAVNMWTFSLNTRQGDLGADSPPTVTSLRVALFFGALCSTVMHAIYSSKLTSILAVDDDPITLIQQLFRARFWIYVNTNVPSLKQLAITNIHESKLTVDPSSLAIDAISKVVSSKSALLTATDEFAYLYTQGQYTREYLCSCLSTIQLSQIAIKSAQFVKHGSPLRNVFNVKLLLMLQSGVLRRHLPEYQLETSLSCKEPSTNFISMDLLDTFLPFAILLISFGLSTFALALERNWKFFINRKMLLLYRLSMNTDVVTM